MIPKRCSETFSCSDSSKTVHFKFDRFVTEQGYDYLTIGLPEDTDYNILNQLKSEQRTNNVQGALILDGNQGNLAPPIWRIPFQPSSSPFLAFTTIFGRKLFIVNFRFGIFRLTSSSESQPRIWFSLSRSQLPHIVRCRISWPIFWWYTRGCTSLRKKVLNKKPRKSRRNHEYSRIFEINLAFFHTFRSALSYE